MPCLRQDEDLIADGRGNAGEVVVPDYLKTLTVAQRKDCEEGLRRHLTEEAIKMIPAEWPAWPRHQVEMAIRRHDVRNNYANQRTYRLGID